MSYRGLAFVLFRCSGVISMVVGLFRFASYLPRMGDVWAKGTVGVYATILLPTAAEFIGGIVLFFLARPLSRLVARVPEDDGVA